MNKTELVAAIAEKAEISKKDAEAALKAFTETVEQERRSSLSVSERSRFPRDLHARAETREPVRA